MQMPKKIEELFKELRENRYKFYDRGGNYNEELVAIIKNLDKRLQEAEKKIEVLVCHS